MPLDKIMTLHPRGKQGVNISRAKYDQMSAAIERVLRHHGALTASEITSEVHALLAGKFDGSIAWYATTVKLDLEARGTIQTVPDTRPPKWIYAIRPDG